MPKFGRCPSAVRLRVLQWALMFALVWAFGAGLIG
jgi:hypothetical protein